MCSEQEVNRAIERYADTVRRLCMIHLKSYTDTEDVFQTVFLKYALCAVVFESDAHEKAWIIRVTINACRDWLRRLTRWRTVPLDEVLEMSAPVEPAHAEVLEAVLALPQAYRQAVYLHDYEGYSAPEVAGMLGRNVNTIYSHLARGRKRLRAQLGGEDDA